MNGRWPGIGIPWAPPVGGPWTPANIPTVLWLDASDASTIDLVGGRVSEWRDKKGGALIASQPNGLRQAFYSNTLNGLPVVSFRTQEWFNDLPSASITSLTAVTELITGAPFRALHTGMVSEIMLDASGVGAIIWPGNNIVFMNGTETTVVPFDNPCIWNMIHTSTARVGFRTLGQEANQDGAVRAWDGDCAEIVDLATAPTVDIRQRLEGYLAHKWGLTAQLPPAHPYKTAPPMQ